MGGFIEDPLLPIVGVKWHKKKPDDGSGGTITPGPPGPCGAYITMYSCFCEVLDPEGLITYEIGHDQATGQAGVFAHHACHILSNWVSDCNYWDYLWDRPSRFTISCGSRDFPQFEPDQGPWVINVWRDTDPYAWNCHDAPDDSGEGVLDVEPMQPNEKFPPIFGVFTGQHPCDVQVGQTMVQAWCDHMTTGALPKLDNYPNLSPYFPARMDYPPLVFDPPAGSVWYEYLSGR